MINLNKYDNVTQLKNTWISRKYLRLYSRVIKYKPYFTICKRYNTKFKYYDYYLILFEVPPINTVYKKVICGKYNILKFDLGLFWNKLPIPKEEDAEIDIELIEEDVDSIVYYLNI